MRGIMSKAFYEKMFTETVKRAQRQYGSRKAFERIESRPFSGEIARLSEAEIDFIETRDGFYMATVNEEGQSYIQFRGGPPGFLKVVNDNTLAYADLRGNLQYISVGNLYANDKAALFLMDHARQRRLKVLVRVDVIDADDARDLIAKLQTPNYKAKIERAMILHVDAFDWNCPQHITPRYTMDEIRTMLIPLNDHIAKLEAEIFELKGGIKLQGDASMVRGK